MRVLIIMSEFLCAVGLIALPFIALIVAHAVSGAPGTDCIVQVEC